MDYYADEGKYCVVCGAPIKTGRKYCYRHRNYRGEYQKPYRPPTQKPTTRREQDNNFMGWMSFGIFLAITYGIKLIFYDKDWKVGILLILFGIMFLGLLTYKSKKIIKQQEEGTYAGEERIIYDSWGNEKVVSHHGAGARKRSGKASYEERLPSNSKPTKLSILLFALGFFILTVLFVSLAAILLLLIGISYLIKIIYRSIRKDKDKKVNLLKKTKFEQSMSNYMRRMFSLLGNLKKKIQGMA